MLIISQCLIDPSRPKRREAGAEDQKKSAESTIVLDRSDAGRGPIQSETTMP